MITTKKISGTKLEFFISRAMLLPIILTVILMVLASVYVILISNQISVKVLVVLLALIVSTTLGIACMKLLKLSNAPVLTIGPEGIQYKNWNENIIPWSNIRVIWSRKYFYPRWLCIETNDQSPAELPKRVAFTYFTPGFSDAWDYIKTNYPDKLEGQSKFC